MSLATVLTRAQFGMESPLVRVEAHVGGGLPVFSVVGLPEKVVKESRERVRAAIVACGYTFPSGRITINLSPAEFPKEGGRYDLPIALGILGAGGAFPEHAFAGEEYYGELSLGGELQPVRGVLPAACRATQCGHRVVLPRANVPEARLVAGARVAGAWHLRDVVEHATGARLLEFAPGAAPRVVTGTGPDLADVRGQAHARRALEIAAAGRHSLLMIGPPGAGKSMLAVRLPGLLPGLCDDEALECAAIASLAGTTGLPGAVGLGSEAEHASGPATAHGSGASAGTGGAAASAWGRRPFRAPHHTASAIALVGGGGVPRPGEISLAHHGVLFLDELPEHDRRTLEVLREPLETGHVSIARAARHASFPARFQLVAAMNPCPCGWHGDAERCRCTPAQVRAYLARLSGPLLDRIDLQVHVPRVEYEGLRALARGESTATVAARVAAAAERQRARQGGPNARLDSRELEVHAALAPEAERLLQSCAKRWRLSARACHRVIKVARTIADLAGEDTLATEHVAEALECRQLDRGGGA
ncbi:MAG: YifB family Mg chelatase-like AAA ATPase [Steroidobacteraceae bacterium]|nr:YifB family Mg chelatase-like AAA ATPase [Steroidobacteraceae bacterium]